MQDYLRKSVSEIVDEINKTCFLPDIQRDFVWKSSQVCALLDSLMRDYPIGTLLLWSVDGQFLHDNQITRLKFVSRSDDSNQEDTSYEPTKDYLLTLDGQQRLTAFYLVLKGNYIIRNKPYDLYFNILSGTKEIDAILYEFQFYNSNKGESFEERDDQGTIIKLWYRLKYLYAIVDIESVAEDVKAHASATFGVEIDKDQRKALTKLYRLLRHERILYYYPEKEKDYDKVLDIFVRINSGGTPLSYSDLLFSTIKSKWPAAREQFQSLIECINSDNYDFNQDFVLKCILTVHADNLEQIKYRTKNFGAEVIASLASGGEWAKLSVALSLLVDLLHDCLFLTHSKIVPSNNALIPVFFWLYLSGKKSIGSGSNGVDEADVEAIRRWTCKAMLSNAFGGQSDTVLFRCRSAIAKSVGGFPGSVIEETIKHDTRRSLDVSPDDIDQVTYSSKLSYLVLALVYSSHINFRPVLAANLPQQDHLFSRNELASAGYSQEDLDSIYNIRYIGAAVNQSKSSKPFVDWIKTQSPNDREIHLIPNGSWEVAQYKDFIKLRRDLFLSQLTSSGKIEL